MRTQFFILLSTGWLVTASLDAQTNPPAAVAPHDVAAAVIRGIDFFRRQAATNEDGWLCLPVPSLRAARYETRTLHFKQITVVYPGYKSEPYETLEPGSTPGDPLRRVTRYRPTVRDPSQDRTVTQEVYDVNGPITRQSQVPIYEKDSIWNWRHGGLGNNGLAILALRRCGVAGDDPLVATPASTLVSIINMFGLPDGTRDLAGLTAGLAVMPGDESKQLTERCASKLLDAQILTGPAAGLWGPVAISTPMVAAYLKTMLRLGDEKKALQADLTAEQRKKPAGGKPSAKANRIEEDIAKIDARIAALQRDANWISQLGFKLYDGLGLTVHYGRITLEFQGRTLTMEALPYVVQNQISADLESTALAVFALRVAFENGRLPMKTWRPDPPKSIGPGAPPAPPDFPAARDARDVLALAAKAINTARQADGRWPEVNIHQPVGDFAWLKSIPQIKPEAFPKLRQPVTLASTVNGAAALANIQMMQTGAVAPTALESPVCQPLIQDLLVDKPLGGSNEVVRAPFDVAFQSTVIRNKRGQTLRQNYTTWNEIADFITARQAATGSWGRINRYASMAGTSLLALHAIFPPVEPKDMPGLYDKPHLSTSFTRRPDQLDYCLGEEEPAYFTLAALLFFADGLPADWSPAGYEAAGKSR